MKKIALIPARMNSTRLATKLMLDLGGKTVLQRTYEAVRDTFLFDEVIVVCDHDDLENTIREIGGKTIPSEQEYETGSDRIAAAALHIEENSIIINIQGDEPFITKEALEKVLIWFDRPDTEVATLCKEIHDKEEINNPNVVKLVKNKEGKVLFFSRAGIPFQRDTNIPTKWYQHIGVYGFRREALLKFASIQPSVLEQSEKLENLRMIENGFVIYASEISHVGISIDTEKDLERAREYIKSKPNSF